MKNIWVYQQVMDNKNPYLYASEYPVDEKELKSNGEKEIGCYCSFKSFLVNFADNIKICEEDKTGKILLKYILKQIGYMFEDGNISEFDAIETLLQKNM